MAITKFEFRDAPGRLRDQPEVFRSVAFVKVQKDVLKAVHDALAAFAAWYAAQPDGPLPEGMINGMFLNAKACVERLREIGIE